MGLLNLLYYIDRRCTSYVEIRKFYELSSSDPKHEFPFILAAFAVSKSTMDALRTGGAKSVGQCWDLYVALMRRLNERWREEKLTILKFH